MCIQSLRNLILSLRSLLISLLALGVTCCFSTSFAADVITVSTWGSPNHGINTIVWPTWGKWIAEATEGRVKLEVVYDLAPPNSQMDVVADGVGDVTWLFHGYYSGRFNAAELPEIPYFVDTSSEEMSKVYWQVHDKFLKKANEHRGVVVLGVGVHGPGMIYSSKAVKGWKDVAGLRLRVGGGVAAEIAHRLDIDLVSMPPTSAYEAGLQGVIDGVIITLEGLKTFRLAEVFPYTYSVPGGLYRGSFSIIINPDKWESIAAADREAIMSVSGEKLSALFGAMMDEYDKYGVEFAKQQNNTFTNADADAIAEIKNITSDIAQQWVQKNQNRGFDAAAALEFFKQKIGAQ